MKKEISWTATTGQKVTVTAELILSEVINADGDKRTVKCCNQTLQAAAEGLGVLGSTILRLQQPLQSNGRTIVGTIGKLGLTEEQYAGVMAMIAEIEASPEWQAKIARKKESAKISDELEAHRRMMRRAMAE